MEKMYKQLMKFEWNPEKNEWLKRERNISFEQVILHLSKGDLWKISDHPDQVKYPGRKIFYVRIEDYVFLVPHMVTTEHIFLKTIIPSRKATKLYEEETGGDAVKYDKEEQFILDELEKGNVVLTGPTKEEIDSIRRTAQNTFKKDKRITIRLYDHDFIGIQKKALEMGIPYQTLISGLIHRYVEGDVKITSG
jgi:predicted DNA binding CopG/RHH family protein/uncharacterized DUF497 family protein